MARFVRAALAVVIVSTSFSALIGAPASGASAPVTNGAAWLRTQQQADGGFEVEGFPGFETPDAVLALGSSAQSSSTWNAAAARAAVLGTSTADGNTPLEAIDTYASGSIGAGVAGKLITLVTNPLELDPSDFDPAGDGAVDLVAKLGSPGIDHKWGISLASFNRILFATRGYAIVSTVPAETIAVITDAQKSDGSWSFDGSNLGTDGGADTTGLAVQALLETGVPASNADVAADVAQALDYLEAQQQLDGAWTDGFSENPNSTAVAMLALSAAGRTPPLAEGSAYLLSIQQPDGHFAGPYDGPTPNTFGTSQAVQGLVRTLVPDASSFADPQTIPAATGGGALSLETDDGSLDNVAAVDPATLAAPPTGVTFPRGLVSFEITGISTGGTATVHLTLPVGTTLSRYFKFNGTAWSDATSLASFADNVVTLTLTDGGAGDEDGVANGVIVDPGGPAVVAAAAVPTAIVLDPRFTG